MKLKLKLIAFHLFLLPLTLLHVLADKLSLLSLLLLRPVPPTVLAVETLALLSTRCFCSEALALELQASVFCARTAVLNSSFLL